MPSPSRSSRFSQAESSSPPFSLKAHPPSLKLRSGRRAFKCFLVPSDVSSNVLLHIIFSPSFCSQTPYLPYKTQVVAILFKGPFSDHQPTHTYRPIHFSVSSCPFPADACGLHATENSSGSRPQEKNALGGHLMPAKAYRRLESKA